MKKKISLHEDNLFLAVYLEMLYGLVFRFQIAFDLQ